MMFDSDAQQEREFQRQQVVVGTHDPVDRFLVNRSDGPPQMINSLTVAMAITLLKVIDKGFEEAAAEVCSSQDPRSDILVDTLRIASEHLAQHSEEDPRVKQSLWFDLAELYVRSVGNFIRSDVLRHDQENPAQSAKEMSE